MVGDTAAIASKFGPRGAVVTGVAGFIAFYFVVPWLLVLLADHHKTSMKGQLAAMMGQMLDEVFIRRFIHPSQWAGIAILLICGGIAAWKALTRKNLTYEDRQDMSTLAKLVARFLD